MPGSVAETIYGRQGGGWVPAEKSTAKPQSVKVPCEGGPMDHSFLTIHSWGEAAAPVELVPYPCGGQYLLVNGTYRWQEAVAS